MIRKLANIATSLIVLASTGCLTTTGGQADAIKKPAPAKLPGGRAPQQRTAPIPAMPSAPAPTMPGATAAVTMPPVQPAQPAQPSGAIAQVGYVTGDCACGVHDQCQDSCQGCQSGCKSCLSKCSPPAPRGYLDCSPQGWNLYGVDPQEFICDGGDHAPKAYLQKNEEVAALQPEDTVVHYTTESGDILFEASNRECLYSPRFASVRKVTAAVAGEKAIGLANVDRPTRLNNINVNQGGVIVRDILGPERAEVAKRIDSLRDRNRGVPVEHIWEPMLAAKVLPPLAAIAVLELDEIREDQLALVQRLSQAAIAWSIGESVEVAVEDLKPPVLTRDQRVEALTIYEFPEGRLRILKLADREHAQPGEIVTFSIRLENVGDAPVGQVTLLDNLITRLEYVEGSQSSTREADFETKVNSEQSLRLQWKLKESLGVGESVTFEFKCLVR